MAMIDSSAVRVVDRSGIAEARRLAVEHAGRTGLDETERSGVAIVSTELATNLLRHARDGVLAITSYLEAGGGGAVVLTSVDQGPGIADLSRSFTDGYSSAGSSGTGLGAVARIASAVDVYSSPEGTVLVAELVGRAAATDQKGRGRNVAGFALAKEAQPANGDAWDCRPAGSGIALLVSDGLGHGPSASDASRAAVRTFRSGEWRGAKDMLDTIDESLRPTRGAAAAIAHLDSESRKLRYCGVGNISGCIVSEDTYRHVVSHNGILGHGPNRVVELDYDFAPGSVLVMHSDGINSRWQPRDLARVWHRHPALIAGLLYRDFARGNDDIVVAVAMP